MLESLVTLILAASMYETPQQPAALDRLCASLEERRTELHIPGMAIAVIQDGAVILARGFGLADLEQGRLADPETLFAIGSTTKAFTAALVGMEVDAGRMAWDDPVTRYLPEFRLPIRGTAAEGAEVTLRDLLCHRTGFTRTDVLWASGRASSQQILAASLQAEPWADFRAEWHYNNVMFLAAGEATAAAAGRPWSALLQERLLTPLGMKSTTAQSASALKDPRLAAGYLWNEERGKFERQQIRTVDQVAPAGAIFSNALDMSRWVRFQLAGGNWEGKQLLSEATLHETWTAQIEIAPGADYGLGWMLHDWQGHAVVEHGGNIDGFAAQVGMIPEEGIGYVLLCNVSATLLQSVSQQMVWEALLGGSPAAEDSPADAPPAAEDLAAFAGEYEADFAAFRDQTFTVQWDGEKLAVDVPGQMLFELAAPRADGARPFVITDQIAVAFDLDGEGRVRAMRMFQSGLTFVLPRRGAAPEGWDPQPDPADGEWTGIYAKGESPMKMTVRLRDGLMTLEVPGETEYELTSADADGWRHLRTLPDVRLRFARGTDSGAATMEFDGTGPTLQLTRLSGLDSDEALPAAAELEARFDAPARAAALAALGGLRLRGTVRFVHGGAAGTIEILVAADGRARHRVDLGVFGHAVSVVDPRGAGSGWEESAFRPFAELEGEQLRHSLRLHPSNLWVGWGAGWDGLTVRRVEEWQGAECAVLGLLAGDRTDSAWLRLDTLDLVRLETHQPLPGAGTLPTSWQFDDFREIGGLRIPHRIESSNDAEGRTEAVILEVETGVAAGDTEFARPEGH
jgi:CubicO group peptidase (beta-lactamase class C family)